MTIVNMERESRTVLRAPELSDWAPTRGRASLTSAEIAELLEIPEDQVHRRPHVPARRHEWITPTRGSARGSLMVKESTSAWELVIRSA